MDTTALYIVLKNNKNNVKIKLFKLYIDEWWIAVTTGTLL